jgi:hypothetical protein
MFLEFDYRWGLLNVKIPYYKIIRTFYFMLLFDLKAAQEGPQWSYFSDLVKKFNTSVPVG